MSSALSRARDRLAERLAARKAAKTVYEKAKAAVTTTRRTIKRLQAEAKPGPWMPGATKDPAPSIGAWTVGELAGLLHTTEGLDFAAMDRVLKTKRAQPHFLIGRDGQIKQYRPIGDAATALANQAGGVETNRKRVVQIEACGFAKDPNWPAVQKKAVAKVMAFCRAHGVPLACTVKFTGASGVRRLSGSEWIAYKGWLGHQHAPENDHWDPGAIDIDELFSLARTL